MKVAIPLLGWGREGVGVRGSRNLGGSSAFFKVSTTKDIKKLFRDPLPEFLDPPLITPQ